MTARNITNKRKWNMVSLEDGQVLMLPPDDTMEDIVMPRSVDMYGESSKQEYPLGTKLSCYGDQEVYRYALCGAVAL